MTFNAGGGYILDLRGDTNKVIVTGSLNILATSPAITMTGDMEIAGGGIYLKDTGSNDNIQFDDNFGIAHYAESPSNYVLYRNMHIFNLAARGVVSGSFGFTQGFNNTSTFFAHAQGRNTKCLPPSSHLIGPTISSGDNNLLFAPGYALSNEPYGFAAHSEGRDTQARVPYSHAEGYGSITTGSQSGGNHAEGYQTIAEGDYAHSEGTATLAQGISSHAEGFSTVTVGAGSHAEGIGTIASGTYQHVQGKYNTHDNITSLMIIGNGTNNSNRSDLALFNAEGIEFTKPLSGSVISASGQLYAGIPEDTDESGTNVVVYNPSTGEFEYTGSYSAIDTGSFYYSSSVNLNEITFYQGDGTVEVLTVDTGSGGEDDDWSISDDNLTLITTRSVIIQSDLTPNTTVDRDFAHGQSTFDSGGYSHAEGQNTLTKGRMSHAEGYFSTASGGWSHAEGHTTYAGARYSHAEGYNTATNTDAWYSHAEGIETQTYADGAHTEGYRTRALGPWSHAAGSGSQARNTGSFVVGDSNYSSRDFQTIVGKYAEYGVAGSSISATTEALFVVGGGVSDAGRKNILVVNTGSVFINTQMLPTSDPGATGQLYRDAQGFLKVSL